MILLKIENRQVDAKNEVMREVNGSLALKMNQPANNSSFA